MSIKALVKSYNEKYPGNYKKINHSTDLFMSRASKVKFIELSIITLRKSASEIYWRDILSGDPNLDVFVSLTILILFAAISWFRILASANFPFLMDKYVPEEVCSEIILDFTVHQQLTLHKLLFLTETAFPQLSKVLAASPTGTTT